MPRVIVEVSPSRVEVAVLRAGVPIEWRCERFGRAEWPSPYTTSLPEIAGTIAKLTAEMGAASGPATIIYSAPGSVTILTSCSGSLRAAEAEQAAPYSPCASPISPSRMRVGFMRSHGSEIPRRA